MGFIWKFNNNRKSFHFLSIDIFDGTHISAGWAYVMADQ